MTAEYSIPTFDMVMTVDENHAQLMNIDDDLVQFNSMYNNNATSTLFDARSAVEDTNNNSSNKNKKISILAYKKSISIPRVLKRDIRRQYPKMIANILNNADFNLFHSFFRTFSVGTNDIRLRVKDAHGVPFETTDQYSHLFKRDLPEIFAYQGYAWIFFHWYIMSTLNPDQIVRVEDANIITRSDTEKSQVSLDVSVDFHRMYDIHIIRFMGSMFGAMINEVGKLVTLPVPLPPSPSPSPRNFTAFTPSDAGPSLNEEPTIGFAQEEMVNPPDPFDYYARKAGKHMPLLPEPQPVVLRMRITVHLNEHKRIEVLETSNLRVQ